MQKTNVEISAERNALTIAKQKRALHARPTRRTREQARHDAAVRRHAPKGWIVQHSHPPRHIARGLMAIGRRAAHIGTKTKAVAALMRVDLITARMIAQDIPCVRKPREFGVCVPARDRRAHHAADAKARKAAAVAEVTS